MWERMVDDDGELDWQLRATTDVVGSAKELMYWRVMNASGKHYFHSPDEYFMFAGVEPPSTRTPQGNGDSECDDEPYNAGDMRAIIAAWKARRMAMA